jgi:hypothetical protein
MLMQAEIGLAEADERIAEAEDNIKQLESLLPELAQSGYVTVDVEGQVGQMREALGALQAQRRSILENLDGVAPPPRIIQESARRSSWREICIRLG